MRKHQSSHFATPQLWCHFLGGWQILPSHPMMDTSSKHKAISINLQNWKHMRKHQSSHFATPQLWCHFLGGWQILPSHPMMDTSSKHKAISINLQNWKHMGKSSKYSLCNISALESYSYHMQPWRSGVPTSFSNGKRTGLWPVFNFLFDGLIRFWPTWYRPPQLVYHFLQGGQILPSHPMMKYHQNIRP